MPMGQWDPMGSTTQSNHVQTKALAAYRPFRQAAIPAGALRICYAPICVSETWHHCSLVANGQVTGIYSYFQAGIYSLQHLTTSKLTRMALQGNTSMILRPLATSRSRITEAQSTLTATLSPVQMSNEGTRLGDIETCDGPELKSHLFVMLHAQELNHVSTSSLAFTSHLFDVKAFSSYWSLFPHRRQGRLRCRSQIRSHLRVCTVLPPWPSFQHALLAALHKP